MKKNICIALILILAFNTQSFGQKYKKQSYNEFGFGLGPSWMVSDLGGGNNIGTPFITDLDFKATRFGFYLYYKRNFNERFGMKIQGSYARLYSDDLHIINHDYGTDQWFRYIRNLRAKTDVLELQLLADFNFLQFIVGERRSRYSKKWTPYITGGVGIFKNFTKVNPTNEAWVKAGKDDVLAEDYPNGNPHSKPHLQVLGGGGIKWNMGKKSKVTLDFSVLYRHTFTDYLDDVSSVYNDNTYSQGMVNHPDIDSWTEQEISNALVSTGVGQQRGDDTDKDHYFTINVGLAFRLGNRPKYGCYFNRR